MGSDKKKGPDINLLELIPERTIGWKKNNEGMAVLLKPKFRHPFFKKHILPRLKHPHYRITLDEIGTAVFSLCNGRNTVKKIGRKLKNNFGQDIEPVFDRLAVFLQQLERNGFISYVNLEKN